jgi:hypothetical protein
MNELPQALGIVLIAAVAGLAIYLQWSRSRSLLEGWATENGYEIVQSEYRVLSKGPFFWTSSKGQTVYYVTIRDGQGETRSGWVRCGSWWFGLMSNKTEVRWAN